MLPCDLPVSESCLSTGSRGWRIPQLQLLEGSANAASPSLPLPELVTPFSKKASQEPTTPTLQGLVTEPGIASQGSTQGCRRASPKPLKGFGVVLPPKHIMVPLSAPHTNSQLRDTPVILSLSTTPTLHATAPEIRQHLTKHRNKFS